MELFGKKIGKSAIDKPEMEMVEKEKQEYKLVGQYLRTKGLRMFSYNSLKDELKEVSIENKKEVTMVMDAEGKLNAKDLGFEECEVDSRNIHFEALNMKNAKKRVQKYKDGKLKELCNLRNPDELDTIKLF
jgi:hypothetical protein